MAGSQEMRERIDVSIPKSASTSGVVYLNSNNVLVGLELPAAFEATSAFLLIEGAFAVGGAVDGSVFQPRNYAGTVLTESWVTVAATNSNRVITFAADNWDSMNVIKITVYEGTKAAAVVQATALRTITAIVRPV